MFARVSQRLLSDCIYSMYLYVYPTDNTVKLDMDTVTIKYILGPILHRNYNEYALIHHPDDFRPRWDIGYGTY